jgi:NDP-sugar pyrophosphorylase family protein
MREMPDAIILCGGAGLRLRSVTGSGPKVMAKIGDRPFLELLISQLRRNGVRRVILALGYQKDMIASHFLNRALGVELVYSVETSPLGTGGALRNAVQLVQSDAALIMNGDSYTDADLGGFAERHRSSNADVSLVVAPADDRGDCGTVRVEDDGTVTQFQEKQGSAGARYLNAGIYMVSRRMLYQIPLGVQISLEQELFRRWLAGGSRIQAFPYSGSCLDIGTPERYLAAQAALANVERDAGPVPQEGTL